MADKSPFSRRGFIDKRDIYKRNAELAEITEVLQQPTSPSNKKISNMKPIRGLALAVPIIN